MNTKTSLLAVTAAIAGIFLYQAGTPRPAASGLRDAMAEGASQHSALEQLRASGEQNGTPNLYAVPEPAAKPVAQPLQTNLSMKVEPDFASNVPADVKRQMLQD